MAIHNRYNFFLRKTSFDDVFEEAYRHSRRISILKFFLPLSALVTALVFCWLIFFFIPAAPDLVIFKNNEEGGIMKLAMLNPKLEGYAHSHEPYWIKADKVFQDHTNSGMIRLKNITAEAVIGKQEHVFLNAQEGIYNNINDRLQLDKPFTITTKDGMVARFMSADIDLSEGQLNANKCVNIQRAGLNLTADTLQIREKRQILYFQGGVHLVIGKQ
ncbi:LPS export ABC transporter periplasmic protein LptC [Bartonella sp. B35(2025)]